MEWTASETPARRRSTPRGAADFSRRHRCSAILGAVFGVISALPLTVALWGFSVDDALITARVATHLNAGLGHRFNPQGPVVDAVTPLGWEYLLAPFAGTTWQALEVARWVSLAAWLSTAALIGAMTARAGQSRWRWGALVVLALSTPLAAWGTAGMETACVALLVTVGLLRHPLALLAPGIAAAWRPELLPFALVWSLGSALAGGGLKHPGRLLAAGASLVLPSLIVGVCRFLMFGSVAPLASAAKPPDPVLGAVYAGACVVLGGASWLVLPPRALLADPRQRALSAALLAHILALVMAGGDWMPFLRLFVPVLPAMLVLGASVLDAQRGFGAAVRVMAAVASSLTLLLWRGPAAPHIVEQRRELGAQLQLWVQPSDVVVSPDVGWVGAAHSGTVVDPAGVTDASVAYRPGGHLQKRLGPGFLSQRRATHVLVLRPLGEPMDGWEHGRFSRAIDYRLARQAADLGLVPRTRLEVSRSSQEYLLLSMKPVE